MKERTKADDIVQGVYNRALLDLILEPMRLTAKEAGYAITVHGSLNRDIDLVCVPWVEHNVWSHEALIDSLCGTIRGITGRANKNGEWSIKPHGRRAKTVLVWVGENTAQLDISFLSSSEELTSELKQNILILISAMETLITDIKTVGNDYPGSSCESWCLEKASDAQGVLDKFKSLVKWNNKDD